MALIKTIAEVKAVLRISSLDDYSSIPDMDEAAEKHIIPKIGVSLYNVLDTKYNANTLSAIEAKLLAKIQKPLVAYAYHDNLSLQHAMITDAGVRRTTTDNMPAAYRWEYDGVKDALAEKAATGMESLLQFLDTNKDQFSNWTSSTQFTKRSRMLVKSGLEFSDYYKIHQPYRTYESLLPIMDDVERLYFFPTIGEAFYRELIAKPSPTDNEKEVIELLKKSITHFAIHHGFEKLTVRMTQDGPTVYDRSPDRLEKDSQPAPDLMSFTMKATNRDANTYLAKAKAILNERASATVFPTYFTSSYYQKPVERQDPNSRRKIYTFIR